MKIVKKIKNKAMLLAGLCLVSLVLSAGAMAADKIVVDDKALVIQRNTPDTAPIPVQVPVQTMGQLDLSVTPNRTAYKVGDTFSINVRGNQDYYLWVFAMNEDAGRGRMLVPGVVQSGNRYNANSSYKVPSGGSYELFMDKPGLERIVVVASTKWIAVDVNKLQRNQYFYSTSYKGMETQLKGLRLLPGQGQTVRTAPSVVVKEMTLMVSSEGPVSTPISNPVIPIPGFQSSGDNSVIFVSQNKDTYRLGEVVTVAYGATKPGWISLFVQYPNGRSEFLKKEHVDGKSIYTLQAEAVRPVGSQNVMAVFSADAKAQFPIGNIGRYTDYFFSGKGLRLLPPPEKRPVYNISRFNIQ